MTSPSSVSESRRAPYARRLPREPGGLRGPGWGTFRLVLRQLSSAARGVA
ncbi:hypothetical protein ACIBBD_25490 [Streptomyces sp. NPDC051315]